VLHAGAVAMQSLHECGYLDDAEKRSSEDNRNKT
jgi:hypothetical protein